ncbi:hypothetical protein F4556_005172 [Kitasatospora gansuensis]|uniref:Uncharacterized protein n=1 Tax=Kitasatospora gansuensis TaxID=258050 RepID=A0A7W7SFW0_9ACTN|nr:hypothetical protein [Kitasatospora gansuensis]MBB4949637.1 hypothetical protein [Kitasatospora gansuensis]
MKDSTRRTIRTSCQTGLALAAGLPLIVDAAGVPGTLPGLGVTLAVAAGVTRVMALPLIDRILPHWLRSAHPDDQLPGGNR